MTKRRTGSTGRRLTEFGQSLVTRAVLLIIVVITVTVSGIILVAAKQHEQIYRQTVDGSNLALATNLADRIVAPLSERQTSRLFLELLDLERYPAVLYARVFDAAGSLVAQYVNPTQPDSVPPETKPPEPRIGITRVGRESHTVLLVAGPDEPLGILLIVTDYAGPLEASVMQFVTRTVLLVAALLGLAFVVVTILVRRALEPLRKLSLVARRITETADLSARTGISGRDEIGTVARSVDRMLATVDRSNREREQVLQELEDRGDQLFRAIQQLENANRELEKVANYDELTGIPNRALCQDRIEMALRRAQRHGTMVATLFLDLDQFKSVNDSLGHDIGDELLIMVSQRINRVLRKEDTLARQGGDEFVVVAEELVSEEDAVLLAQRILGVFSESFPIRRWNIAATTSIGIALGPDGAETPEAMMQHADAAMYQAKEQGGNCHAVFREDLREKLVRRLGLAMDLRTAIGRDEFEIHYQPKVAVSDGRIVGFEGLLRWRRRGGELVPPAEFIPIAESSGLISDLSLWVFERGAREIATLRALRPDLDLHVALNVSPMDLQRDQFITGLQRLVQTGQVDPSWTEIELTESTLMEDTDQSERLLDLLADMGFSIAIDDFGTGYSALSYLTRIPLHALKIDKSFVDRALESAEARAVVRSVISLCRDLGLEVCAEGVETDDQERFLRAAGVDLLQGYRFGRPAPFEQLLEHLEPAAESAAGARD